VTTYPNKVSPVGTQEFAFEFRTPDWLPESSFYRVDYAGSNFSIQYKIFAQMIPELEKDFDD
jgi:hypothetical protein